MNSTDTIKYNAQARDTCDTSIAQIDVPDTCV